MVDRFGKRQWSTPVDIRSCVVVLDTMGLGLRYLRRKGTSGDLQTTCQRGVTIEVSGMLVSERTDP